MTFSASPSFRDWKATPTHWPAELNAGPPELPGLIAASICTASKSHEPCTYCCAQPRPRLPVAVRTDPRQAPARPHCHAVKAAVGLLTRRGRLAAQRVLHFRDPEGTHRLPWSTRGWAVGDAYLHVQPRDDALSHAHVLAADRIADDRDGLLQEWERAEADRFQPFPERLVVHCEQREVTLRPCARSTTKHARLTSHDGSHSWPARVLIACPRASNACRR